MFSLTEMENMSTERQFKLMKTNIGNIRSLIQVMSYSLRDPEAETRFLFSDVDRGKLGSTNPRNSPITITQLTTWAPIGDKQKQDYLANMMTLSNNLLRDKKIFVMMLMILLFDDKSDPYVSGIHVQYWSMLKRYLEKQTKTLNVFSTCMLENLMKSLIK